jgi:hypothetical protein
MSDASDEFPNPETVLRGWLVTLFPTVRIVSELPADLETELPVLQVVRGSGDDPRTFMAIDRAVIDVDVWHADRVSASAMAETVRRYIRRDLPGTTIDGAVFAWATTLVAPRWQPDPNPKVRRFTATYEVGLHPA